MSQRDFITLYASPVQRADAAAKVALDAVFAGGGLRAARFYDRCAEAHQIAVYREHCARQLGLDQ